MYLYRWARIYGPGKLGVTFPATNIAQFMTYSRSARKGKLLY